MRRRVAIIAGTCFPPIASASVHRVLSWLRYLPLGGWEPEVFTLPLGYRPEADLDRSLLDDIPDDARVHRARPLWPRNLPRSRTANAEIRGSTVVLSIRARVASSVKDAMLVPDARILWVPPACRSLVSVHRRERFDAILSTSQQNSSHVAGLIASASLRLPWVADFQDPWHSPWLPPKPLISRRLDEALARKVVQKSTTIVVTSKNVGRSLQDGFDAPASKIDIIPNGFDPSGPSRSRTDRGRGGPFTIVHTGRFYGRRNPATFLSVVERVVERQPEGAGLLVRFIGSFDEPSAAAVARYASRPWLEVVAPMPHAEALQAQADADLLLLIPGEESMSMPGKVFEYLRAGPPILCLASDDADAASLLRELAAGTIIDPSDTEGLRDLLADLLDNRLPRNDMLGRDLEKYGWPTIVARMATALTRAAG